MLDNAQRNLMGINLCRLKSQSTVIFGLEVKDQICFNKFVIATIIVSFCSPQMALRLQGLISIYMKQIVNLLGVFVFMKLEFRSL